MDSSGAIFRNQRVVNNVRAIIDYVDNVRDGRLIKGALLKPAAGEQLSGAAARSGMADRMAPCWDLREDEAEPR